MTGPRRLVVAGENPLHPDAIILEHQRRRRPGARSGQALTPDLGGLATAAEMAAIVRAMG
jgi:hypothetical protein